MGAATASISRPSSPMDNPQVEIGKNFDAQLKLEDLIDQDETYALRVKDLLERVDLMNIVHRFNDLMEKVQTRMSDIGSQLNEFGGVQKEIDSIKKWIKDVEST